jgi:hypothetical protein
MEDTYYRFVLIGNGYDRALGLKTSYADFILSMFKTAAFETFEKGLFENELIKIVRRKGITYSEHPDKIRAGVHKMVDAKEIIDFIQRMGTLDYKYDFFEFIVNKFRIERWIDIENQYFEELLKEYKVYQKNEILEDILLLNECMDKLSAELKKYLLIEQNSINASYSNSHMASLIDQVNEPLRKDRRSLVKKHNRTKPPNQVIFVNFNYTNTVQKIIQNNFKENNCRHIHIHGNINDIKNPIIFGYGDDTSDTYNTLELEGVNELLRKVKSFEYPRTNNYHNLLNYLSGPEFDVFIVGHSCGLSDRTLLKTIFEHPNCMAIQNFHYSGEPEDFNKRMEISRHFSDKVKMRERVLSFDEFATIPQPPKKKK